MMAPIYVKDKRPPMTIKIIPPTGVALSRFFGSPSSRTAGT